MRILLLLLLSLSAPAATLTVCASGCTYSNFQSALNAANRGDILELKAGEVFEGAFSLPFKSGSGDITVRTSRWRELPPPGTRVTAADAVLMPTIQPNSTSVAALEAGAFERQVTAISAANNTLTFSSNPYTDGNPIACRHENGGAGPIVRNQIYYVRDATGTTIKLADLPGGPVVDLTTEPSTVNFFCVDGRAVANWRFVGIEFRKKPGQTTEYYLLRFGSEEMNRVSVPNHIYFEHSYIHGLEGENGPRICVVLNAANASITDSRIDNCNKEGEEGKAISAWQSPGPVLIRNNYIAAGSINLLLGGDYMRLPGIVNGDSGGFEIVGNHFTRDFSVKYSRGTGGSSDPMGACTDDNWYLNTTSGAWFRCVGSTWTAGPTCATGEYYRRTDVTQSCVGGACWQCSAGAFVASSVYRASGYATKNLFEIKSGMNLLVRGNVFENNWTNSDQSGVAVWITSQVSQYNGNSWVRGENIRFEDNIVRNSPQGFRIASEGSTTFGVPNNRIRVRNNLLYAIGATQYPSINSGDARPLSFAGPCVDCSVDHNTIVSGVGGGTGMYLDTAPLTNFKLTNTIGNANAYGVLGDLGNPPSYYLGTGNVVNTVFVDNASSQGAPSSLGAYATSSKFITPATTLFVGGGDYRLSATSPYSASCASGCDFTATDGKDLGADIDAVDAATLGAVSGTFNPLAARVSPGSTGAVVSYLAPTTAGCTLKLYNNAARTTLNAGTDSGPEQADSRAGNISSGRNRQFVLSGLTASTPYWYVLNCSGSISVGQINTRATGAGATFTVKYGAATTGEYSSSADMSSPTAISSSTTHSIPVPSASVRYYRATGGPISVYMAP